MVLYGSKRTAALVVARLRELRASGVAVDEIRAPWDPDAAEIRRLLTTDERARVRVVARQFGVGLFDL